MTKRQFCDRAYLRACSLPTSGFLSSALASSTMNGKLLASRSRKSMKPLVVFSKLSPSASRSVVLIVTLGSRRILAGTSPSAKKRQPARVEQLVDLDPGCGFLGGHSDSCLSGAGQAVSRGVDTRNGGIVCGMCIGN